MIKWLMDLLYPRSYSLRKINTRPSSRTHVIKRGIPILQKRIAHHIQVPLRRNIRPHYSSHARLYITLVRLPSSLSRPRRHIPLQPDSERLVAYQPRERRRQGPEVEIERVDAEGFPAEPDGGDVLGGRGAGVRVEGLVAVVGGGGEGEGVRDQLEDCVRGGWGREDQCGACVDDCLSLGVWTGGGTVHEYGVEHDLPIRGYRDGDLGKAACVS